MAAVVPWKALEIQVPGKDLLSDVRDVLETLVVFLDVLKVILNTVKAFLSAIGNPIKALVLLLISFITSLLESLRRSGFYSWLHFPDFKSDPSFKRHAGGYPGFVERWKGSLLDAQDINRPRPIAGFNTGGFVMIVADVQGPSKLIRLVKVLVKFFSADLLSAQYGAPSSPRVLPIGDKGDPILKVAQWFKEDLKGLAVEWGLPTNTASADPSFSGLAAEFSQEFVPPQWLVERTSIYPSEDVTDFAAPGVLVKIIDTEARNPRTDKLIQQKIRVVDEYGQPVILMEDARVINASSQTLVYIIGLLGKYRYLDYDVKKDKAYWYRIRGFSGTLDWNAQSQKINFNDKSIKESPRQKGVWYLEYPGKNSDDAVVMGQATPLIPGRLPKVPAGFDVVENLRNIFLAAFSLNFQLPLPLVQEMVYDPVAKEFVPAVDASGYPIYKPIFDVNGDPIPPATNILIGQGSLAAQAGTLAAFLATPVLSAQPLAVPGAGPPWTLPLVRLQAAKLANTYASLALEAGSGFIDGFQQLMQNPLPFGPPDNSDLLNAPSTIKAANTLEALVASLTATDPQPTVEEVGVIEAAKKSFVWTTTGPTVWTYGRAFNDKKVRRNVLAAVDFVKTLGYQGQPPDWTRISLLQDMLPWSAQMLYDMLNKIQALVDAYNDLMDEIVQFINMLLRKIEVLEKFIQFLIMILNAVQDLSAGFYLLSASGLGGGVSDWFRAIDEAGGNKPPSTRDGGYTAGLCLAYLAPDVTAIETALKKIF